MQLRTPWVWKPPLGAVITPAPGLGRGLRRYWLFAENGGVPFESVTRTRDGSVTNTVWTAGELGPALGHGSNPAQFDTGFGDMNVASGAFAMKFYIPATFNTADGANYSFCGQRNGLQILHFIRYLDGNIYAGWYWNGAEARIVIASDTVNMPPGAWSTYVVTWGPFGTVMYRNGVVIGSNSTPPTVGVVGANFAWLTGAGEAGSLSLVGSKIEWAGLWERALSPRDAMALTIRPYAW